MTRLRRSARLISPAAALGRAKEGVPTGPMGRISAATLVLSVGSGAWYTCWAVYFTRSFGLSVIQFGVGITIAGVIATVVGSPLGYLADRAGTREVLIGLSLIQGLSILAYVFVRGFWPFLLISCVAVTAQRTAPGVRIAVISALTSGSDRLHQISANRVVAHIGMAAGSAVGALILWADSRPAYLALVLLYGAANIASAVLMRRVPHVPSVGDHRTKRRMLVLRDRPFLLVTLLSGILALNWGMLSIGVPLWITTHTRAPVWTVGVITAFNAVAIIFFQNRVSRGGATVAGAARLGVYCGIALAASCLVFAVSDRGSGALVVVLLLAAAGVHAVGELLYVASGWGLSVGLTPRDAHGEYQSTFGVGPSAALTIAPLLLTTLVAGWGVPGWFVLAALFLAGGIPTVATSRYALRSDQRREMVQQT